MGQVAYDLCGFRRVVHSRMNMGFRLSELPPDERLLIRRIFKFLLRNPHCMPQDRRWWVQNGARLTVCDLLHEWGREEAIPTWLHRT